MALLYFPKLQKKLQSSVKMK